MKKKITFKLPTGDIFKFFYFQILLFTNSNSIAKKRNKLEFSFSFNFHKILFFFLLTIILLDLRIAREINCSGKQQMLQLKIYILEDLKIHKNTKFVIILFIILFIIFFFI